MGYVVVVVLLAAGGIVYVRRRTRRRMLDLRLALVGFEASGKTVFSGCMFHELRVPGREGIFLDTTPESASSLLALYNATADTDAGFPVATAKGELREWPFSVKAKSAGGVAEVARFSYLDFAGESLREMSGAAPNPQTTKLRARFAGADVLMGVLDGLEVKHYLEGRPSPKFHEDLGSLLAVLSNHRKAVADMADLARQHCRRTLRATWPEPLEARRSGRLPCYMSPTRGVRHIEREMDPNWNDNQPIYRQLRDRMVALILEGALKEGDPVALREGGGCRLPAQSADRAERLSAAGR